MIDKNLSFNDNPCLKEHSNGFRCLGLIAEVAKDYENAEYFYRQAGCIYSAYQMKKSQLTLEEKAKRNKELSKKFRERTSFK